MEAILHQLGELVLGSVPTMLMFVALVAAYGLLVRRPLDAVLMKRRELTKGALEQAFGAMNAAEAETAVFENRLRIARTEIFAMRDQRLASWRSERDSMLSEARAITAQRIESARREIERDASAARQQIEAMSSELSAKILKAVLPLGVNITEAAQ